MFFALETPNHFTIIDKLVFKNFIDNYLLITI